MARIWWCQRKSRASTQLRLSTKVCDAKAWTSGIYQQRAEQQRAEPAHGIADEDGPSRRDIGYPGAQPIGHLRHRAAQAGYAALIAGLSWIALEQAVTAEILGQAVELERRQCEPAGNAPEGDKQPVGFRGCWHEL